MRKLYKTLMDLNAKTMQKEKERERELTEPVTIVEMLVLSPNGIVNIWSPTHATSNNPTLSRDLRYHNHKAQHEDHQSGHRHRRTGQ